MNFKRMLLISRPVLWFATGSAYLLGIQKFSDFSWLSILELLFFLFPLNFYLYGLNDIYDINSDKINPRKGSALGAILTKSDIVYLKKIFYIPPLLFFIIALFSWKLEHIILALIFIFASFAYSYPLFRFKEIFIIDTITSTLVYTSPIFIAYSLHDSIFTISPRYFLLLLPFMGLHALSTLVDASSDIKAGIKTTGNMLGKNLTILFMLLTIIIPLFFFLDNAYITIVLIFGLIVGLILLTINKKDFDQMAFAATVTLTTIAIMSALYFVLLANFY